MVEFRKKNIITADTVVSKYLSDIYNGGTTTASLYGALDMSKYMFQADIPATPAYGNSELKRLDLELYVNSINVGNEPKYPQIATYLFKDDHTITEGYASLNDEVVFCMSGTVGGGASLSDYFDGSGTSGGDGAQYTNLARTIVKGTQLYTTVTLAEIHGQTGYKWRNFGDTHGETSIRTDFGLTAADLGMPDIFEFGGKANYIKVSSNYENSSLPYIDVSFGPLTPDDAREGARTHNYWRKCIPNASHVGIGHEIWVRDYYCYAANEIEANTEGYGTEATPTNTIFEQVRHSGEFTKGHGENAEFAGVGVARFNTEEFQTSPQALELFTFWAGAATLIDEVTYGKHGYTSSPASSFTEGPADRQEVMLLKKNIPYPIPLPRMPSAEATTLGLYDRTQHGATISMDIKINKLAPAYKMTNNSTTGELLQVTTSGITDRAISFDASAWDWYTLGRAFTIIWSTKPPEDGEDLYSYIARMSNLRAQTDDGRDGEDFGGLDNDKLMGMAWSGDWDTIDSTNDTESIFSIRQSRYKNAYFGGVTFINGDNGPMAVPLNGANGTSTSFPMNGTEGFYLGDHNMASDDKATQQVYIPTGGPHGSQLTGAVGLQTQNDLIGTWYNLSFVFDPNSSEGYHGAYGADYNILNDNVPGRVSPAEAGSSRGHRSLCRMYISNSETGELLTTNGYPADLNKKYLDIALMGDGGSFESYADGIRAGAGNKVGSVENWPKHMSIWLTNMKNEKAGNYDILPDSATQDMASTVLIDKIVFKDFNFAMSNGTQSPGKMLTSPISFMNGSANASPDQPDQLDDSTLFDTRKKRTPGIVTFGLTTQDFISNSGINLTNMEKTWTEWPYGFWLNDFRAESLGNLGDIPDEHIKVGFSCAYYSTGETTKAAIPLGHQLTEVGINHYSTRVPTNRHPNYKVVGGDYSASMFKISSTATDDSFVDGSKYFRIYSGANSNINGNFSEGELVYSSDSQNTYYGRYAGDYRSGQMYVVAEAAGTIAGMHTCTGIADVSAGTFTDSGHGLEDEDAIVLARSNVDEGLIHPRQGQVWYVNEKTTNTFKLSGSAATAVTSAITTASGSDISAGKIKYQKLRLFNNDSAYGTGDDTGLYLVSEPDNNVDYNGFASSGLSYLETGYTVLSNDISAKTFTIVDHSVHLSGSAIGVRVGDKIRFVSPTCKADNAGSDYTVSNVSGDLTDLVITVSETIVNLTGTNWNKDDANYSGMTGGTLADNDYAGLSIQIQTGALCDNFAQKGGFQIWKNKHAFNHNNSIAYSENANFNPIKRENIAASARVVDVVSQVDQKVTLAVDTVAPFLNDNTTEKYIVYLLGETPTFSDLTKISPTSANCKTDVIVESYTAEGNTVTLIWDGKDGAGTKILDYENIHKLLISPFRYWVNILHNLSDSDENLLSNRTYGNVRLMNNNFTDQDDKKRSWVGEGLSTDSTNTFVSDSYSYRQGLGTTFNELLFNDTTFGGVRGAYINSWALDVAKEGSFLDCNTDHGFGVYTPTETNELSGGFTGMSYVKDGQYNTISMPQIVQSANLEPEDTINFLVDFTDQDATHTFNLDTKDSNNNPPYFSAVYEDEKPQHPTLSVKPYEEDPFFPEYTWEASDDDLWYGILIMDNVPVNSQYHKRVLHLPMNEKGSHGQLLSTNNYVATDAGPAEGPYNLAYKNSSDGLTFKHEGLSENGIKYDLEGMAGNCYRFDGANSYIRYSGAGTGTYSPFASATVTFTGSIAYDETITIISTDGTSKTYTAKADNDYANNEFDVDNGFDDKANALEGAIEHASGHNGKILVSQGGSGDAVLTLTQVGGGTDGNTTITSNLGNTDISTESDNVGFTGGSIVLSDLTTQASWSFHVTPDNSAMNGATNYIFYSDSLRLSLNASTGVLSAKIYSGEAVYTLLTSNPIPMDDDTPSSIIVTFDSEIPTQNCKLFINGKQEDVSGPRMASATNTESWPVVSNIGSSLYNNNGPVYIGSGSSGIATYLPYTNSDGMVGLIEEVVIYNICIYPIVPSDGTFVWTKPVKEVSYGSSLSWNAKLFIKDFHNVRGPSTSEVATSSTVSFRKAAFRLDGN